VAEALRRTLIRRLAPQGPPGHGRRSSSAWLAALPVALILGPLLPGLYWALAPSLDAAVWQALWADAQWPQALQATLLSALLGTALGVAITVVLATL
jgi:putative thiamine transport system permease protein